MLKQHYCLAISTRFQVIAVILSLFFTLSNAQARPELGPPSIKLRSNVSNVIVAEYTQRVDVDTALFIKRRDLHNEAPEQIELKLQQRQLEYLGVGEIYILAYIEWTTDRLLKKLEPRPGGPVLISLPGATPAVFLDSPELRKIFSIDIEASIVGSDGLLELIRAGLKSADWQYQNFFVTEIATRPNLQKKLTDADRELIADLALSSASSPYVPQFLFQHGDFLGDSFTASDKRGLAREILQYQALQQDEYSLYPALIRTAMHYLKRHGNSEDAEVLVRWLAAEQLGLVEGSLDALRELALDDLPSLIDQALGQTLIHKNKRQMLKNYQRRVEIIRQQQKVATNR